MSTLPSNWATAPLGAFTDDCTQRIPGEAETFTYIDIGSVSRETKHIESPQRLLGKDAPSRARKHVRAGDVLVSMTRPNLNAVALVPENLDGQIASTGFDVLRASSVDPRWVFYLVRSAKFVEAMSELVQGALYPAVRSKDVRGFEAVLAPRAEQTRIADKLDAVLARVDACRYRLDRIPSILKRFRQSVLTAATSGALTEDWRNARDESEQWTTARLEMMTTKVGSGATPKGGESSYKETGTPLIRSMNVVFFGFKRQGIAYIDETQAYELRNAEVRAGDVLLNITGASIGRVTIAPPDMDGARVNQHVCIIRPGDLLLPEFLCWTLAAPAMQQVIGTENYGVTRQALTKQQILDFDISTPPVSEQIEVVRRVETLFAFADRLEARCTAAHTQVEKLTPSLLAKAFRGELVPQDPNDEPASALLERVAAKRAATEVQPRRRQSTAGRKPIRATKENAAVTKNRQDEDVQGKPYLAQNLRLLGGSASAEALFKVSELPVADFYKQLAWEVAQGHVRDGKMVLELADAA